NGAPRGALVIFSWKPEGWKLFRAPSAERRAPSGKRPHFMSLLTLDNISLAFGHLPLVEHASLRVEAGERICLIGRNGTGKSSLLKVLTGELARDGGAIWRAPGLRTARLEQDVPGTADRSVFDEVASGLGE